MSQEHTDNLTITPEDEARKRLVRAMVKQVIEEIVDEDYYNPLVPGLGGAQQNPPGHAATGEG